MPYAVPLAQAGAAQPPPLPVLVRAVIDALARNDGDELDRLDGMVRIWRAAGGPGVHSFDARSLLRVLASLLEASERNLRLWRRVGAARGGTGYGEPVAAPPWRGSRR
jgi:hypothetical protein